jgi:lysyl-tRNA synthetase, class II
MRWVRQQSLIHPPSPPHLRHHPLTLSPPSLPSSGRIFRNEGLSPRHNPEFTSIELYEAYTDYHGMMRRTEAILGASVRAVTEQQQHSAEQGGEIKPTMRIEYQGVELDFTPPYRQVSMRDMVIAVTGIDFNIFHNTDGLGAAKEAAHKLGIETHLMDSLCTTREVMNMVFEELCESTIIQPTFITDHPLETSPLSKPHRDKEGYVERFELYIAGREIANAFSELTDPIDQRERFVEQIEKKRRSGAVITGDELDNDFISALETGMPPTAGLGIGIDRLVMLLSNSASIRDVIAFPLLRKSD